MKYTDRKKAPLKWHHILMFLILPLMILLRAYITLGMTSELMGLHLPFVTNYLELLLSATGVLITNLGSWFWPVAGIFIVEILLLVWLIVIWISMLRWKNKGRIQWLLYLLVEFAVSGVIVYIAYERLVVEENYIIFLPLLASIHLIPSFVASHLPLFIAILAGIALLQLVVLILNFVYYHKRRSLFARYYTKPEEMLDAQSSDKEATVVSKEEEEQTETIHAVSEEEVPSTQENDTELASSTAEENNEKTVEVSPSSDEKEEMLFCPNCGARLSKYDRNYCTHCGTKLHD